MSKHGSSSGEGDNSRQTNPSAEGDASEVRAADGDPSIESTAKLKPPVETTLADEDDDSAQAIDDTPRPSERFGDYELLEEIARGGMGIVFKARHLSLNRIVALKVIRSGRFSDAEDRRRFQIEAEAAARLDHPHIIPVYEVGTCDGHSYFTMGYVEGHSLEPALAESPLPPREAADLASLVASAIHYAHLKGVIHRDLKPSNILLVQRDAAGSDSSRSRPHPSESPFEPRVTDFGLALRVETSERLTVTGQILGTPAYMSPEQAAGKSDVGPATDVYSLGATLYRMLVGRPPFRAATLVETLLEVQYTEPAPPRQSNPRIPRDLETICLRCLAKDPRHRYGSAGELADDLDRFLLGETIRARPASRWERCLKWGRRRPALAFLIVVIAAALVIGGSMLTVIRQQRAEIEDLRASFAVTISDMDRLTTSESYQEADFFDPGRRTEREQTIAHYEQLIPTLERRVADSDDPAEFRPLLASYYLNLGALQLTIGSPRTEESLLKAEELFQQALADDPSDDASREGLAIATSNLGQYYAGTDQPNDGEVCFDAALQLAESLPAEQRSDLSGRILAERGLLFAHQGRFPEAEADFDAAEPILRDHLERNPSDTRAARELGRVQYSVGLICVQTGRFDGAEDHYERALKTQQGLVDRVGTASFSRHDLASTLSNFGQLVWQLGDQTRAENLLIRAVKESRLLNGLAPSEKAHEILGRSTYHLASLFFSRQDCVSATPLLEESLTAFEAIEQDTAPDLPALRQAARFGLLTCSLQVGDHQRAFEMIKQMIPDSPVAAEDRFQGAGFCARCSTLAAGDIELSESERTVLIELYGNMAIELLREAVDAGFDDAQRLNNAPEWTILMDRSDLQEIVKTIEG